MTEKHEKLSQVDDSLQTLQESDNKEMGFLDHLEELRWRILRSIAAVIIGAILCFTFSEKVIDLLIQPYEEAVLSLENQRTTSAVTAVELFIKDLINQSPPTLDTNDRITEVPAQRRLQALRPMTYFFISIQVALLGGLLLALPVVFLEIWKFIAPGLLKSEQQLVIPIILLSIVCFSLGGAVAYFLVLPMGLRFFLSLEPPDMTSQWAADEYTGFVIRLLFGFGIVFEMPVLAFLLSKAGVITSSLMRKYRRYAIIGIFIIAAFITPPDPVSQLMMALPLLGLYEISIWICRIAGKERKKVEPD